MHSRAVYSSWDSKSTQLNKSVSHWNVGRLHMLLSCSRCVTTQGAADASPCGEAMKICLCTLKGLSNRFIQSSLNYVEEIFFNEVAKPQIDQEKVIKTHNMIVSQFATTPKATNKALSHAEGRVKAVESELKGSAKVCLCSLARLSTDCWSFTSASPMVIHHTL